MLGSSTEEHLSNPFAKPGAGGNPFAPAAPTPAPARAAVVAPAQPRMESQSAFYAAEQQQPFGAHGGASFGGGGGGGVFLQSAPGKECADKLTPAWAKKEACLGISVGQIIAWSILLGIPYLICLGFFITNLVTAGKPYIFVSGKSYGPCGLRDPTSGATASNIATAAQCPEDAAAACLSQADATSLKQCVVTTTGVMTLFGVTPRSLDGISGVIAAPFIYPADPGAPFSAVAVFVLSTAIFLINGFLLLQRSFWAFATCWLFCQVVGEGLIWAVGFPVNTIFLAGILGNSFTWCSITAVLFEYLGTRTYKCRTLVVSVVTAVLWCAYIAALVYGAFTSNASIATLSSGMKRDWLTPVIGSLAGVVWSCVFFFLTPKVTACCAKSGVGAGRSKRPRAGLAGQAQGQYRPPQQQFAQPAAAAAPPQRPESQGDVNPFLS